MSARIYVRVYASAMLSRTCVEKKRPGARGRARTGGRRYFFTRNERVQGETCIRLAEGGREGERVRAGKAVGVAAVVQNPGGEDERRGRLRGVGRGTRRMWQRVARGWSTLCRRFFGAFFYGRRPSLAWMNEHGEEHQ